MRLPRIALAIGLATALGLMQPGRARANGTRDARAAGLALFREGRFQEAIPYFDQVLARHRRDLEVLSARGVCYLRLEEPEKALADFDRVNQNGLGAAGFGAFSIFDPLSTWLQSNQAGGLVAGNWANLPSSYYFAENWANRGAALLMLGRDQEALSSFLMSLNLWYDRLAPSKRGRALTLQGLGQCYHRLGQNELAVEVYTQSIALYRDDPNGFVGRGDALAALRLADPAIADYTEAIRLDTSHSRAYCGRGCTLADLGREEPALADLNRAIELDPKYAKAYSYRGALHAQRGRNELALKDYDILIRLLPQSAGAYKDRGGVLVRLGRFDRAIDDLTEAIRLDPKRATAYQNRGAAYNGLGQYERAIEDLSRAIEIDPGNAGAFTNRGLALFAIGRYDQAVIDLSEAIRVAPRSAIPYFNRAEVFIRLGWRDRALQDYDEAIRLEPRIAAAYAASGRLREEKGQRDQAARDYDMALQLDPEEVSLYYDRGNVRRQRSDWLGAVADYDRAIVLDPKRAEVYVARGWSRLCVGVEGADYDARAYLALKGWHDGLAPYMSVLAVLGARRAGRTTDAARALDEGLANLSPHSWPVPVLRYWQGTITETALLQSAVNTRQQAEVQTFLGLDRLGAGDSAGALVHLRWAKDHGQPGSIAADVAAATLKRLEPSAR
jgi:tetratricopeptide (TPR) repeat protein